MTKQHTIAAITLWVNRLIILAVTVLLFTLPMIIDWYCTLRQLLKTERLAITVAFYCCAVVIFFALWNMDRLLLAIRKDDVFIRSNVKRIRRIQICCGLVSLICLPASFAYMPLIFLVVIMAFLCLAVSVVSCVMDSAVSLREENDLTI